MYWASPLVAALSAVPPSPPSLQPASSLPLAEQPKKGAVCQVPGCDRSLHKLRDYYKASCRDWPATGCQLASAAVRNRLLRLCSRYGWEGAWQRVAAARAMPVHGHPCTAAACGLAWRRRPACRRLASLHLGRSLLFRTLQRYKICPYHLELPCLVVEGQTIRFCQQCGRFQLLTDFEGDRRSCRRKLDKHNERRRKAEAEQKARMMDSGSDSPGSTRGVKVQRVSPYRAGGAASAGGGGGGYAAGPAGGGDLGARLQALASDPLLRVSGRPGWQRQGGSHSAARWWDGRRVGWQAGLWLRQSCRARMQARAGAPWHGPLAYEDSLGCTADVRLRGKTIQGRVAPPRRTSRCCCSCPPRSTLPSGLPQDGVAPGLLQTLADPGMAGMDWLAAGSLTNLAVGPGPAGTLPPMPTPAPPPMPPPMPQPGEMARGCRVGRRRVRCSRKRVKQAGVALTACLVAAGLSLPAPRRCTPRTPPQCCPPI